MLALFVLGIFLFWFLSGSGREAQAIPQFPARLGLGIHAGHEERLPSERTIDCRACHINPTGGGMRNRHGRQFALQYLRWNHGNETVDQRGDAQEHQREQGIERKHDHAQEPPALLQDVKDYVAFTGLSRFVNIGADLRFMYIHSQPESTSRFQDAFFPMQADLYLALSLIDRVTIVLQDGIGGPREYFGLIHQLPYDLHLKFGRFIPPYGLKLDDHTSFIRDRLLLGVLHQDVGIESGFATYPYFFNLAVFNGARGSSTDDNRSKGVSTTGGVKGNYVTLAGSYYSNNGLLDKREYYGGYATARYWRLTWLGEWDRIGVTDHAQGEKFAEGTAVYQELDLMIHSGAIIKVKYDFFEPNRKVKNDERHRITFGVDLYPAPSIELTFQYWRNIETPDLDNDQALALIHLYI